MATLYKGGQVHYYSGNFRPIIETDNLMALTQYPSVDKLAGFTSKNPLTMLPPTTTQEPSAFPLTKGLLKCVLNDYDPNNPQHYGHITRIIDIIDFIGDDNITILSYLKLGNGRIFYPTVGGCSNAPNNWNHYEAYETADNRIVADRIAWTFAVGGYSSYWSVLQSFLIDVSGIKYLIANGFSTYYSRKLTSVAVINEDDGTLISGINKVNLYNYRNMILPLCYSPTLNELFFINCSLTDKNVSAYSVKFDNGTLSVVTTIQNNPANQLNSYISSIPCKVKKLDDGSYEFYKLCYTTDVNDFSVVRYTFNPDVDKTTINQTDCTIDTSHFVAITPSSTTPTGGGFKAIRLSDGTDEYLLFVVEDIYSYSTSSTIGFNVGSHQILLYKIDSADPTNLIFVGAKQIPTALVGLIPIAPNDYSTFFLVTKNDVKYCQLTFDENIYSEISTLSKDGLYPTVFATDDAGRFYIAWNHGDTKKSPSICVYSDDIPDSVNVALEKDFYDYQGSPIDSYLTVNVKNWKGEYISAKVKLVALTDNVVFSDGSTETIVTTSNTGDVTVNIQVTGTGQIDIGATVVEVV